MFYSFKVDAKNWRPLFLYLLYNTNIFRKNMTLKIKDREVNLKYSFRSFFIFENIMNRSFQPNTTTDILVFFYSVIMASDKNLDFQFDEFLDMVDENPELIVKFSEFISKEVSKNRTLSPDQEDDEEKKTPQENTKENQK